MYCLYSFIQIISFLLFLIISPTRRSHFASIGKRMGFFQIPKLIKPIWIHAVSVGEVLSVKRLIERIRQEFPNTPIVLSTITLTGQQVVHSPPYQTDALVFFPFDLQYAVNRVLSQVDPKMVVIAETEIWPHFLRACKRRKIPVLWVNGRISDKSYPRYLWIRSLLKKIVSSYTVIGMQSELDCQRVLSLGADPKKVFAIGNLKYDISSSNRPLPEALVKELSLSAPLWIAASTMPLEEKMVLDTFSKLIVKHPNLMLLIAPRHPDRFDEVASLIKKSGYPYARRSQLAKPHGPSQVILLDSLGELAPTFEFARVVFVGGSLVPHGGHNILEPAFFSKPILFGPHMENFSDMAKRFLQAEAAIEVLSSDDLAAAIDTILSDASLADKLGKNARKLMDENQGATERTVSLIRKELKSQGFPPEKQI
ncbi:MAG: 3-deoxy-D-manno-octulosonic acid transferase [Nitrospirae bacterium]|nr:3-deoxy-D-manno-octulosonic acid transferase [Candidatus Troglogloeales bacterium]MBI3598355.1 3-deoxy-D-manno-octulosonic acid transferase [Candidatus Troglogloeales bacterium]